MSEQEGPRRWMSRLSNKRGLAIAGGNIYAYNSSWLREMPIQRNSFLWGIYSLSSEFAICATNITFLCKKNSVDLNKKFDLVYTHLCDVLDIINRIE